MSPLLRRLFLFSLFLTFASLALMIVDLTMGVRVPVVRPYLPYGLAVGMVVMLTIYVGHVGKPADPREAKASNDADEAPLSERATND